MRIERKIKLVLIFIVAIGLFNPIQNVTGEQNSVNTVSGWGFWIAYSNGTVIKDNAKIPSKMTFLAVSNESVQIAFVFINGKQVLSLTDWSAPTTATTTTTGGMNYKISQGGSSGNYTHPFSLIIPLQSTVSVNMTGYNTNCDPNNAALTAQPQNSTATDYTGASTTNSTNSATYACSTTTTATSGYEAIIIIPGILLIYFIRKRTLKKQ